MNILNLREAADSRVQHLMEKHLPECLDESGDVYWMDLVDLVCDELADELGIEDHPGPMLRTPAPSRETLRHEVDRRMWSRTEGIIGDRVIMLAWR